MDIKYYTIKYPSGKELLIHDTWDKVQPLVKGVSGVLYKSHWTKKAAKEWLASCVVTVAHEKEFIKKNQLYLYVDGSFYNGKVGWGWVAVINHDNIAEDHGCVNNVEGGRNIVGELKAAMESVKWAFVKNKYPNAIVVHDYQGISAWVTGQWRAKKKYTNQYKLWMQKYEGRILFEKCSGHTGIYWNEYADQLASLCLG